MRKLLPTYQFLRHAATAILIAAAVSCLAGCSAGDADEPWSPDDGATSHPASKSLRTGFYITVSDTSGEDTSRASRTPGYLGDGYDRGEGYENYIDIDNRNFRFYFFDENNRFVSAISIESITPAEFTPTSKTYYVNGSARAAIHDRNIKAVALVNWPTYPAESELIPGETTIADLCGLQYDYTPVANMPSAEHPIPLFGVGKLQTLQFDYLDFAEVGTLHLLRAYSKVEVIRSEDCIFDIEYAKIVRYNTLGYCAPAGVNNESDYVHGNYDADYVVTPNIPAGAESTAEFDMTEVSEGHFVAYVPEYRNLTATGEARPEQERTQIKVRFLDASDSSYDYDIVEFKDYASGKHFNLLRNYWYRFTVNKRLAPMVQMVPYNEVELDPNFGLLIGINYVPVYDENGIVQYWYDPDTGKYYGADKVTEIDNPYLITVDPATGWSLVRDENNQFICYHDEVNQRFIATDRRTRIIEPFGNVSLSNNDWLKIQGYYSRKIYYYYDRFHSRWYLPDKVTVVERPFDNDIDTSADYLPQ